MKISVSLQQADLDVLDRYMAEQSIPTRSAAIQRAVQHLAHPTLEQDYAEAWDEWVDSGEEEAWQPATGDGLPDATR